MQSPLFQSGKCPSVDLQRSDPKVTISAFTFSSPSAVLSSSLYAAGRMSTWSCQTWTRLQERAPHRLRGEKRREGGVLFFRVISRSRVASCTLVRSFFFLQMSAKSRTESFFLPKHVSSEVCFLFGCLSISLLTRMSQKNSHANNWFSFSFLFFLYV